ncbi:hypothetical protein GG804_26020 [Sphingomonas histidinilytica]|uniref:hypothetical protein n=1 Tax=Rhizorhabdus histidinilytica TaxID=439228 RepID=UPI001ADB8B54|nr:hypothetical protein [Rhizorhabdus histidinilytica]MBO9380227.1 hypothetical protein [Rhizorhabdus histidinilytica]
MTDDIAAGGRFPVAFSFFNDVAGVSPMTPDREATVAIRKPSVRGAYDTAGMVAGQPVEVLGVSKSPVEGYTRVTVRYLGEPA